MKIVYGRVSTEDQGRQGYSLGEQLLACRVKAAELTEPGQDATILEFQDEMSGDILERPGLQNALDIIRQGGVTHFITLHPDRLARNLSHQLLIYDEIRRRGTQVVFVQASFEDSPEGRLFLSMSGAVAEYEKAKILERMSRGARGKARTGGLPHLVRWYGYDFIAGKEKTKAIEVLVPNEVEAGWLRASLGWIADEGLGPNLVAKRLNALGVRSKMGKLWSHGVVRRTVTNPAYVTGKLQLMKADHRGIAVARQLPKAERLRKKIKLHAKPKPKSSWIEVEVTPIVPRDLWERAQEVLSGFRIGKRSEIDPRCPKMLTGLGRCGICGARLQYFSGRKIVCSGRYRHYVDPNVEPSTCNLPAKPIASVEAAIWEMVRSWILEPEMLKLAATRSKPQENTIQLPGKTELDTLRTQVTEKEREQERIGLLFTRGHWSAETALPLLDRVKDEIAALRSRIQQLEKPEPKKQTRRATPLEGLLADPIWMEQMRKSVDQFSPAQQAELVRLVVDHFVMNPSPRGKVPVIDMVPAI